jgi:hypothetical protein
VQVTLENQEVRFDEAALARMESALFDSTSHLVGSCGSIASPSLAGASQHDFAA